MTFINRSPKFHIETFICVMLTFWIYEQLKKTVTDLNITNYIHKTHRKSSSITHWKSIHYKSTRIKQYKSILNTLPNICFYI